MRPKKEAARRMPLLARRNELLQAQFFTHGVNRSEVHIDELRLHAHANGFLEFVKRNAQKRVSLSIALRDGNREQNDVESLRIANELKERRLVDYNGCAIALFERLKHRCGGIHRFRQRRSDCLLYTSDAADEL